MKVEQADQFAEMSMVEVTKALAKMWRELDAEKKNKVIKSFEKVILNYIFPIIFTNDFRKKKNTQPSMKNGYLV